ncbi:hypothetical protein [Shouchella clausii]|uniref:Uncharacterized protein n=1 Tax=Shouchella clausii TaxID=79880 RepID=A0A268NXU8_SHOCL|nr:hypothetical protein [Shouchella clausii]MDO7269705.1 hypothetical protein [Shouchella clausii]MDO7289669.1 hypothetical protein [Shouchella clausii]PAE88314.1 hypothetical protein CHH72_13630 [Shouchella clausii]
MKQVLFAVGALWCLAGCGQNDGISLTEDDVVQTEGTIVDVEFEGDYQANADAKSVGVSGESSEPAPTITSFDVDANPQMNVLINRRTEIYVKHLNDYLRVDQSFLKPELEVEVYGEPTTSQQPEETKATKIVILTKEYSIKGIVSNVNEEQNTFFVLGEDGHYESGTRFHYDVATEVLELVDEDEYEPLKSQDLESGLVVEVVPRGNVEETIPQEADAARVVVVDEDKEELESLEQEAEEDEDEQTEEQESGSTDTGDEDE